MTCTMLNVDYFGNIGVLEQFLFEVYSRNSKSCEMVSVGMITTIRAS